MVQLKYKILLLEQTEGQLSKIEVVSKASWKEGYRKSDTPRPT